MPTVSSPFVQLPTCAGCKSAPEPPPGAYGRHAESALANGFEPVPTHGKRPILRKWQTVTISPKQIKRQLTRLRGRDANLALRTGRLLAIDIDADDRDRADRLVHLAFGFLGPTSFIRVGRWPRRTLFYRLRSPVRSRKGPDVEILSEGRSCVVAGIHPDTGNPYAWPEDSLLDYDITALPEVGEADVDLFADAVENTAKRLRALNVDQVREALVRAVRSTIPPSRNERYRRKDPQRLPEIGDRNNWLFAEGRDLARTVTSLEKLTRKLEDVNRMCPDPLPSREVDAIAQSVWRYKQYGRLMVAGRQSIALPFGKDVVKSLSPWPEATHLYAVLRATRKKKTFEIPQKATARFLGWGSSRVAKAIDALLRHDLIRKVPRRRRRTDPILYEWGAGTTPPISELKKGETSSARKAGVLLDPADG